jgi:excinuclease ABC subunit A
MSSRASSHDTKDFVQVRGAREHNLKNIDVDIPRDAMVVFTGISGSGKSSLAFGTLYAEAQRRYLESVSPHARSLFRQLTVPDVDSINGLPPAIALQQQRGSPTTRSSVGSVTTLSNILRMLYSRAGDYPPGEQLIYAEGFSPNTPEGACPNCHGLGRVYEVTEASMVPDPSLTIRERAIAAWPRAWGGQNQRDILVSMGYDVDRPWRDLAKKERDWILFTDDQPEVPVYPDYSPAETRKALKRKEEPNYMGTFTSARRHLFHTLAHTQSALMRKQVLQYMLREDCPVCHGKRLKPEALRVTFTGLDIADLGRLSLRQLVSRLKPFAEGSATPQGHDVDHPEKAEVARRLTRDLCARLVVLHDLGLGYLSLERSTPTLSPGELQRLRLATQLYSNLFGVVYVLDEPSAGLHPSDTEALLKALDGLKRAGNSLFVVEHNLDVVRRADWLVDVGPEAGEHGGKILYSGPPPGLAEVVNSKTREFLFEKASVAKHEPRKPIGWLDLQGVTRNNLHKVNVSIPLGVFTSVTGVSGSGKSTLVSQVLVELVREGLGLKEEGPEVSSDAETDDLGDPQEPRFTSGGKIASGLDQVKRLVRVDQQPIGRTPRSNLATYTGLFDHVREIFATTPLARKRHYNSGRFSFNVAKGRCETCQGEGFVMVELHFLPSVYSPCPACHGARYNADTLEVEYRGKNIAAVLGLRVDEAWAFFADDKGVSRALSVLREVGLGYLRLGQAATELSGGEAQRIKLATELQRQARSHTLYVLDEPTSGLHPADVEKLLTQLNGLVTAGHTVLVVEHNMRVIARSDWVIEIGPGAGDEGGTIVAQSTPIQLAESSASATAPYLARFMKAK